MTNNFEKSPIWSHCLEVKFGKILTHSMLRIMDLHLFSNLPFFDDWSQIELAKVMPKTALNRSLDIGIGGEGSPYG